MTPNEARSFGARLRDGWKVAYYDNGSVVVESPTGFRERIRTWIAKP